MVWYVTTSKIAKKKKNRVFLIFWEKRVVALWRYVATSKMAKNSIFSDILGKSGCGAVAICGDMWRHQQNAKNVFF